jgi:hypothetical protein
VSVALIGHTGFVGSYLASQATYDLEISRANLSSLHHQHFSRVVCAGLPAAKWLANREPEVDLANMHRLCGALEQVTAEHFILISTIDVYPITANADESFDCATKPNHPYGTHRLQFETFVRERFASATIVRLPALFGRGLKKNVLFDLLHDNCLEAINSESTFQWYPLARLAADIQLIEGTGLPLVNLFPEPIRTADILNRFFPHKTVGTKPAAEAHYDLRTRYGALLGGDGPYAMGKEQVMVELADYIESGSR